MFQELVENLSKGELPKSEYACMNDPQAGVTSTNTKSVRKSQAPVPQAEKKAPAQSMRSRRTATWARSQHSDDGYSR